MENRRAKEKAAFAAILTLIAISIYAVRYGGSLEYRPSSPAVSYSSQPATSSSQLDVQKAENERIEKARLAVEEAAVQHAKDLARYLNPGFPRKAGYKNAAVVTATGDGKLNRLFSDALAKRVKAGDVQTATDFVQPEFLTDGLFKSTFDGSRTAIDRLDLASNLDALILARQTVQYSQSPSLDNLITASMGLEVTIVPVLKRADNTTWSYSSTGAGFKEADARTMAEERLLKQIANDTNHFEPGLVR